MAALGINKTANQRRRGAAAQQYLTLLKHLHRLDRLTVCAGQTLDWMQSYLWYTVVVVQVANHISL